MLARQGLYLLCLGLCPTVNAYSQPPRESVEIVVSPNHADWKYKTGEQATFSVSVFQHQVLLPDAAVNFEIGPEKMEPASKGTVLLKTGTGRIGSGKMDKPGFLRCVVTTEIGGVRYRGMATAAFSPEAIQPTVEKPADFRQFWDKAKADAAQIPMDARMTLMPERCTERVNVYQINVQNYQLGARLYGILCLPKKEGTYPAILHVPGSGVLALEGDVANAEKGMITLQIGIHGIPLDMPAHVYLNLTRAALKGYPLFNLDHRDRYYYKRVYLGCIRAVDYLFTLPQFDQKNLAVEGGSQGGALALVTASLDPRVNYVAALYPALCDVTGYLHNRAGGWPHLFSPANLEFNNSPEKIRTAAYYDVVNFARDVRIPGFYFWGYNDEVCPPTSMHVAYNVVQAPKELVIVQETGHWLYPKLTEMVNQWLAGKLLDK